jgi:hypothetical protein
MGVDLSDMIKILYRVAVFGSRLCLRDRIEEGDESDDNYRN